MGAWSEDNFGNDDAGDWVYSLEASKGVKVLMSPILQINSESGYLESHQCCEALAAAEVIAAALKNDFTVVPEGVASWLNSKKGFFGKKPNIERQHAISAIEAIEKILNDSELKELWEETEEFDNWQKIQKDLLAKLKDV